MLTVVLDHVCSQFRNYKDTNLICLEQKQLMFIKVDAVVYLSIDVKNLLTFISLNPIYILIASSGTAHFHFLKDHTEPKTNGCKDKYRKVLRYGYDIVLQKKNMK